MRATLHGWCAWMGTRGTPKRRRHTLERDFIDVLNAADDMDYAEEVIEAFAMISDARYPVFTIHNMDLITRDDRRALSLSWCVPSTSHRCRSWWSARRRSLSSRTEHTTYGLFSARDMKHMVSCCKEMMIGGEHGHLNFSALLFGSL